MHLIIFDIDGTLIDSHDFDSDLYVKSIQNILNINIVSEWGRYKNVTDSGILDQIIEENNLCSARFDIHSQVRRYFVQQTENYIIDFSDKLMEIPGAKRLIETLKSKRNVALAIATGGWEETAKMKLQVIGVNPDNLSLASASDSSNRIEIIQIAEKRALNGITASQKTYFGDGSWDKKASEQLNYQFIAVGNKIEHNIKVPDFRDLDKVLLKLGITSGT